MFNKKKSIEEHPYFNYLKDHELRTKEKGTAHLEIRDTDFDSSAFRDGGIWKRFIFKNCHFKTTYGINLDEMSDCYFYFCTFGPGPKNAAAKFGTAKVYNRMFQCKFTSGNVSFDWGKVYIQDSEFIGERASETSWNHFIGGDELELVGCKFRYIDITVDTKLHMKSCDYLSSGSGPIGSSNKEHTVELIFEKTKIGDAEKFLKNNKIKSLTLRDVEVDGTFSVQWSDIKESIVLEKLKVGTYDMAESDTEKQIIVRDCHFSEVNKKTTHLFQCSGDYAIDFLMERTECTNAGGCDLTGAGNGAPKDTFAMETTRNKTFTVRDCKIPKLLLNGLQTFNLVIENCELGKLEMIQGRIGNVTIRNTRFETLDLTDTKATKYDIDATSAASGKIITAGSDYPKGGYRVK
jgi:hypothetical protein